MSISVTYVIHVLEMLEVSRNVSRFPDTIENSIFARVEDVTEIDCLFLLPLKNQCGPI